MGEYEALMAARKACRICVERNPGKIRSCAEFDYDPEVVSHWELWLGHKNPKLLVVGQDFGNVDYFVRNRGRDEPDNKTNDNLWKLLAAAGIQAKSPRERDAETRVFLTNSVLCLKEGKMSGPVRASWVTACTKTHLLPLVRWLNPPFVVGMGNCGWRAVREAFQLNDSPRLISRAAGTCWTVAHTSVFAVGHCSPLGLINRPWAQQVLDWQRIGAMLATATVSSETILCQPDRSFGDNLDNSPRWRFAGPATRGRTGGWRKRSMSDATAFDTPSVPILSVAAGRAVVRLNRPRHHNRIEPQDLAELERLFGDIDHDRSIRVLTLTASGKSFSSGFHIGALVERRAGMGEDPDRDAFERTVDRLEQLRVPTIAALNGSVYGGATDLALACDFRIGVEGIRLLMPAARLGIVYYESGLRRYVTRLGVAAAKKLFLTAQPIDAGEMLAIGYLDEIVPAGELMARAAALADTLAVNAPLAVAGLKRAINETAAGRLDRDALAAVRALCSGSDDHREALRAWDEKRIPRFVGR
jgi:enoyl-CoA hydratase